MLDLIIIGNSGAALECHALFNDIYYTPQVRTLLKFKGFLSHKNYKGNLGNLQSYELGNDEEHIPSENNVYVVGIADNLIRHQAYMQMKEKGGKFINLISPYASLDLNCEIGEANIIMHGTTISNNTSIGNANYFNGSVGIGHHVNIGNVNFFATNSMLFGNSTVGNYNHFSPSAMLMEKGKVGNHNKIAPASVLYKGCRDNCLMAGNPAIKLTSMTF